MNKLAVILLLIGITAGIFSVGAFAVASVTTQSGDSTINITAVQYSRDISGVHSIRHYLLYNLRLGPVPIGNALTICLNVGTKHGPFRQVATYCQGTYSISHNGSLQVEGVSRGPYVYQYAIIGGTGQYVGAGGQLAVTVYSQRPRRELLKFNYSRI